MIFSVTAKRLISYDSSSSDGRLWKQFDAFLGGLVAFPVYIPGTAFYKCMQVNQTNTFLGETQTYIALL
jgi:cytochrome P450 family 26 subfamily A